MIDTIMKGLFSMFIALANNFLSPIYSLIANIDLGGYTIADALTQLNLYITLLRQSIGWVANATGIPGWLFALMGLFMIANLTLRIAVYVIKLLLKWYRKLMP